MSLNSSYSSLVTLASFSSLFSFSLMILSMRVLLACSFLSSRTCTFFSWASFWVLLSSSSLLGTRAFPFGLPSLIEMLDIFLHIGFMLDPFGFDIRLEMFLNLFFELLELSVFFLWSRSGATF
ncbi:unnamed protein product [Moneuplotes crassus]|uniref:Uncharacterized protein n=1 Tax=Euplotes crassus TaxID=5936 RepID=A0AAD2D418_EUPCR|nr:unnamed protein product [Moneuplotes crassus]